MSETDGTELADISDRLFLDKMNAIEENIYRIIGPNPAILIDWDYYKRTLESGLLSNNKMNKTKKNNCLLKYAADFLDIIQTDDSNEDKNLKITNITDCWRPSFMSGVAMGRKNTRRSKRTNKSRRYKRTKKTNKSKKSKRTKRTKKSIK
jgi:hypothetical protein